ncbi:hypothetical protein [Crocinitomix catalasitica]|uniref:hypothetical protein n=1 Tax=Crocinitomix catalasitica TaxID=184607 RepID=UPI0004865E26|nr:hypothetical protein [Crocinitomix catalasitica]
MDLDCIQYRTISNSINDLKTEIDSVASAGITTFRIPEQFMNDVAHSSFDQLCFIVDVNSNIEIPDAFGVHFKSFALMDQRKADIERVTGATANTLLDCKNLDLQGLNYIEVPIDLGAVDANHKNMILGSEGLQALLPKEIEYGWMLLSLATPIMASGIRSMNELEILVDQTAIHGVILDQLIYRASNKKETVQKIQSLFKLSSTI